MNRKTPDPELRIDAGNLTGTVAELGAQTTWDLIARQFKADRDTAFQEGFAEARRRDQSWEPVRLALIWCAGVLTVGALIGALIGYIGHANANGDRYERQLTYECATGNTVRCIEAVQEKKTDPDRANVLRKAYELHTGHPLPSTDPGGVDVAGYDVKPEGAAVRVEKGAASVTVRLP